HPDLIFVGYEWRLKPSPPRMRTEIVIEQMRQLSERLAGPATFTSQVAFVEPPDAVHYSAWNAILKTLRQPLPGPYLWLVSANPTRLPATIRSRCQRLEMRLPPRAESLAWLEARGHGRETAAEALDAARGHPGLAASWLEGDGLALRREVAADLAAIGAGRADPLEVAQRWGADERGDERLRHAAEYAVGEASSGLTDPVRLHKLAAWFDNANRTRELLRSTVRGDLAMADLLLGWRDLARSTTTSPAREERGNNG